jgi:hypothetical protein
VYSIEVQRLNQCKVFHGDAELIGLYKTAYPHSSDEDLQEYYKTHYKKLVPVFTSIATRILSKYYPNYKMKPVQIEILPPSDKEYADLEYKPGRTEPSPFRIPANSFESPAGLASTLGHEIIHQYQMKRQYTVRMTNLNDTVKYFWELEASTWELAKAVPKGVVWEIGINRFLPFLTPNEVAEAQDLVEGRKKDVRSAICNVMKGPRSEVYSQTLAVWIEQQDPWVKAVWLNDSANKKWRDCSDSR